MILKLNFEENDTRRFALLLHESWKPLAFLLCGKIHICLTVKYTTHEIWHLP